MARPQTQTSVENWSIESTGSSPMGEICRWVNSETDETITLPKGQIPDVKTLTLLAMNAGSEVVALAPGDDSVNDDEIEPVPESAVDRIMVSLQVRADDPDARAEVKIYKIPADGPEMYCGTFSAQEFEERNLELVRTKFGAGKYRIIVNSTTPKVDGEGRAIKYGGRLVRRANQTVEIAASLEPLRPGDNSANSSVIEQVLKQNQELIARLNNPSEKPQTMVERLQELKLMQEIFGSKNSGKEQSMLEKMSEIAEMKKLAKELAGEGSDAEPGMMSVASKALEMIGTVTQQRQNAPAQAPQQPQLMPMVSVPASLQSAQPNPVDETQPNEERQQDVNTFEQKAINIMVNSLCKQAAQNGDIEPQAEFLYEKLPEELFSSLQLPQWWEMFSGLYPQVEPHQEWFTRVRNRVLAMINEEPEQ